MKKISTTNAPYSQAYVAGDFLFTSGQGGLNPARTCIAVKELPLDILCEVEAVVYLEE